MAGDGPRNTVISGRNSGERLTPLSVFDEGRGDETPARIYIPRNGKVEWMWESSRCVNCSCRQREELGDRLTWFAQTGAAFEQRRQHTAILMPGDENNWQKLSLEKVSERERAKERKELEKFSFFSSSSFPFVGSVRYVPLQRSSREALPPRQKRCVYRLPTRRARKRKEDDMPGLGAQFLIWGWLQAARVQVCSVDVYSWQLLPSKRDSYRRTRRHASASDNGDSLSL